MWSDALPQCLSNSIPAKPFQERGVGFRLLKDAPSIHITKQTRSLWLWEHFSLGRVALGEV